MTVTTSEHRIATPEGHVYAKRWHVPVPPESPAAQARAPILLNHDSLGAVSLWRDFPALLAQACGRDVVAYDRLGFGQSDANPEQLQADFVADEVQSGIAPVLAALNIEDFVLLGHSVGGGMAAEAAAHFGARCKALITESVQTFVEDRTLQGIGEARDNFAQPGQLDRLARYHGDKAAWVLSAWVDTWFSEAFASYSLQSAFERIQCPVLAIHGGQDEFGSLVHPENIVRWTNGAAQQEIIATGGHVPHKETPQPLVERIAQFLQAVA